LKATIFMLSPTLLIRRLTAAAVVCGADYNGPVTPSKALNIDLFV
jgi:hypothetical protein